MMRCPTAIPNQCFPLTTSITEGQQGRAWASLSSQQPTNDACSSQPDLLQLLKSSWCNQLPTRCTKSNCPIVARGKDKGACLGLVELPATHDGGGPVVGEVEGVDKGGVAVVVDAHGAALIHADKQRPERVVQQRNRAAALKIHRRHMLPQPCIAAHRPAPAQKNFIHHCCGVRHYRSGQFPGVGRLYFVRDESCTRMHVGLPSRHAIPFGLCSRMQVRRLVLVQWAQTLKKTEHILGAYASQFNQCIADMPHQTKQRKKPSCQMRGQAP